MALHFGDEASETVRFIEMFDKFFDAVNVSNFNSGKHSRKCFKDPYRSGTDFRLKASCAQILATYTHAVFNYNSGLRKHFFRTLKNGRKV